MKFTFNLNKKEFNMNRAKMFSLTAGFVLAMAFTLSCEDKEAKKAAEAAAAAAVLSAQTAETPKKDDGSVDFGKLTQKFTDSRDGKTYKTVKIGTAVWMAENLNFAAEGSKCYENNAGNCEKYGRLYNWATALKACPAGFHLPSDDEWTALVNYAGGEDKAGTKLKSAAGWNKNGNGTNDFGWSALPGGEGDSDGGFGSAGGYGWWWSATESDAGVAWRRGMIYDGEYVGRVDDDKTGLFSVRCVKDNK